MSAPPGSGEGEARGAQLERGAALRGEAGLAVTPCAYEHYALIAAYGAPERVEIRPPTGGPVTPSCPRVEVR